MVYRMPLDGSSPSALGVAGAPIDQFSFLESEDGNLNGWCADSVGDGMWARNSCGRRGIDARIAEQLF